MAIKHAVGLSSPIDKYLFIQNIILYLFVIFYNKDLFIVFIF